MRCLSHLLHAATAATLNKIKAGLQAGWEQTAVMRVKRSIQGEGERRGKGGVKMNCRSKQRDGMDEKHGRRTDLSKLSS